MVAASAVSSSTCTNASNSNVPSLPPQREVARPVANLGNTCYMNAVLQALAHAPELCLAMDCEPHRHTCPIYIENTRRARLASPTSSPEGGDAEPDFRRNKATAKRGVRRSSRKSPTSGLGKEDSNNSTNDDADDTYCTLCEMEYHLTEVHKTNVDGKEKAVAPNFFVHGFIKKVAPWFKLGQQEDSHEFLRLLIDAMQNSCKNARPKMEDDAMEEDIPPIGDDDMMDTGGKVNTKNKDVEYPFQLFRGTVESCVTCDSCKASSSTLDPIEDVGLEVTPHTPNKASGMSTRGSLSSPGNGEALADVSSAFQRFARVENLDAQYKCEKCGKGGRATKQSRLASIPPILTLHLKRFRYGGDARGPSPAFATSNRRTKSGSAKIEGHIKFDLVFDLRPYLTDELQSKHKKMFCRLFAVIVHAGKNSHSGHYVSYVRNITKNEWWKMDDARVTLASNEEVMQAEAYMLFYRILDHPVAVQLEDQAKKMKEEVERLAKEAKEEEQKAIAEAEAAAAAAAKEAAETEKENVPVKNDGIKQEADAPVPSAAASATTLVKEEPAPAPVPAPSSSGADNKPMDVQPEKPSGPSSGSAPIKNEPAPPVPAPKPAPMTPPKSANTVSSNSNANTSNSRKRGLPDYLDGKSWAKANTRLKTYSSIDSAQDYINENIQFKQDFFRLITEEGNKPNAKVDHCPLKRITPDDVVGGFGRWEKGLKECIFRLARRYEKENPGECFFTAAVPRKVEAQTAVSATTSGNATAPSGDDALL
ncbi:Inactive ubiquitin carboxyl-terminal hydrolase 17-like protein [Seminavis robusta]|uniref:ubiquitinyl hydrolase 1 n=1 Tax=Seminavis robusta TaxID=568900 RepID=A0A9N8DA76_9STRA|nr:Inactive ubiquitin carboxyl-terminal hydrolase 17-like protein [Seminavis robusta]|eukprot:Sro9_g007560.1 Inactive ubiquitin carboxyl-terminal hydrolase 17-like protein (762) ;mRNA; f:185102-187477